MAIREICFQKECVVYELDAIMALTAQVSVLFKMGGCLKSLMHWVFMQYKVYLWFVICAGGPILVKGAQIQSPSNLLPTIIGNNIICSPTPTIWIVETT